MIHRIGFDSAITISHIHINVGNDVYKNVEVIVNRNNIWINVNARAWINVSHVVLIDVYDIIRINVRNNAMFDI